jgi:hypothetical protein
MTETAQRLFLHVGVPKSGTTFLQATLAGNRDRLLRDGVLYPRGKQDLMFRAALDLRGNHRSWGRTHADVLGSWDELCAKARGHAGTTVASHELLAAAGSRQVARAMTMLKGLDVHLVVTARDPARQLVGEWQEAVKHGATLTFREFREQVSAADAGHPAAERYAAAQDLPRVLARWSAELPAERVHVVCSPPPGSQPRELWRRFASAVGLDESRYEPAAGAANASLGVVEIDLLRRVNLALEGRLVQPAYGRVVKHYLAQRLLASRTSPRPVLPAHLYDDLTDVAERWAKEIDKAGWTVHGNLADLLPVVPQEPVPDPDAVDRDAEVASAAGAVAELLVELEATRSRVAELKADRRTEKRKRKSLKRRLAEALQD